MDYDMDELKKKKMLLKGEAAYYLGISEKPPLAQGVCYALYKRKVAVFSTVFGLP